MHALYETPHLPYFVLNVPQLKLCWIIGKRYKCGLWSSLALAAMNFRIVFFVSHFVTLILTVMPNISIVYAIPEVSGFFCIFRAITTI